MPDGRIITTLLDAGRFIAALPESEQRQPHWQTATEAILMAVEGRGPVMHARIGMLRALNAGKPPTPIEPRRKRAKRYRIVPGEMKKPAAGCIRDGLPGGSTRRYFAGVKSR